ncbi:DUF1524 domain-containing protein [Rhodococcus sp. X156]|uniref:GmrSD restriction endonuclease domain-containing protein n=1 Tax=Rhodococcus sp. X156 TaxID=2499145 RepID=UPI000FD74CB3
MALVGAAALSGCSADTDAPTAQTGPAGASPTAPGSTAPGSTTPPGTPDPAADGAAAAPGAPAASGTALAALATLPVKGRAPKTGYSRDEFGAAWADVDRNGCDTRNDVLARDLTATSARPGTRECVVLTGVLQDPYSGKPISFTRGETTSAAIQIDHVVALSDAWQKGAQQLDRTRRTALANDPLNLLAVDGPLNNQKSDSDAASWLPPNRAYRCAYVARQVAVKTTYALWVTQAERDAIAGVLQECPAEPLPTGGAPAAVAQQEAPRQEAPQPPAAPAPAPQAPTEQAPGNPATAPFASCAAARAAGAAPVHRGEPGYSSKIDRDGDGVGCE